LINQEEIYIPSWLNAHNSIYSLICFNFSWTSLMRRL
jgi:hypothetical protein